MPATNDLGLGSMHERRPYLDRSAFDTGLGRQTSERFERLDELGPTVRVAGIVERIHADEDIARSGRLRSGDGHLLRLAARTIRRAVAVAIPVHEAVVETGAYLRFGSVSSSSIGILLLLLPLVLLPFLR